MKEPVKEEIRRGVVMLAYELIREAIRAIKERRRRKREKS